MRVVGKLFGTLIILMLLSITIILTLLHTQYASKLVINTIDATTDYQLKAANISYHISDPWHIQLEQPQIMYQRQPLLSANNIQLWLTPTKLLNTGWSFDSILIDTITLNQPLDLATLPALHVQRLALNNLTLHTPEISIEQARLQIDNWQSRSQSWGIFRGDFQLSAPNIQWQGTTLKDVLIDGDYQDQNWKIYGLSFEWQHATFSGQAEYKQSATQPDLLTLHQLTVTGLQLQDQNQLTLFRSYIDQVKTSALTIEIKRLDVLESNIEMPNYTLNNINLSVQNWQWPATHWQQHEALVSLNASSIQWLNTVFEDPLVNSTFSPQQITVNGLSTKVLEGYVQLDGTLTPDVLALNQVTVNGIKWVLPNNWPTHLRTLNSLYSDISITQLDIGYAQLTDTNPANPFQIAGLNINGENLILKRHGQVGLWQGTLTANSGAASVNKVSMIGPYTTMNSQAGNWQLKQLILPFKDGLLEASGNVDLNRSGQPWKLSLQGDNIPATTLSQWLAIPFPVTGAMDVSFNGTGLAQHQTSLAYSFTGDLIATFRQLQLSKLTPQQLLQYWGTSQQPQPTSNQSQNVDSLSLSLSPLSISADRGRMAINKIELRSKGLKANLKGRWDLADTTKQTIELQAKQGCQQLTRSWGTVQQLLSASTCKGNNI
ncbi:AsmA family protein [Photobacterium frigidiphilum]|uniref:AsmA family protein n=1 Tax=Photobacterium frigidiphilum TaxID=264736 RepID=A0A2T3JC98_9GAMM|nr:AsmA family protein [Photobacterium frigidiphilum]PSU46490.1 AsmA family protein [Photobacterium frigidiphilum]